MSLAWQQDWERWESDRLKQAFVVERFTKSHQRRRRRKKKGGGGESASWPPSWQTATLSKPQTRPTRPPELSAVLFFCCKSFCFSIQKSDKQPTESIYYRIHVLLIYVSIYCIIYTIYLKVWWKYGNLWLNIGMCMNYSWQGRWALQTHFHCLNV